MVKDFKQHRGKLQVFKGQQRLLLCGKAYAVLRLLNEVEKDAKGYALN